MITIDDLTLLDLDEVAHHLGLARSRVEGLVRNDELAGVLHGGRWMVAREELDRFSATWTPPVRRSRVGVTRRFVPPPRPGDLHAEG